MKTKTAVAAASALSAILLFAAGAVYFRGSWKCRDGAWTAVGHPLLTRRPTATCAAPVQPMPKPQPARKICAPAWSCGSLSRGEAGMKGGSWYLKYEDVGGPAMLEIAFSDGAKCSVDGQAADCHSMNPPSGSASSFSGHRDGDMFIVSALEFTTKR